MKKNVLFVSLIAILAVNSLRAQMPGDKPAVVRLDPALDALVSAEAKLDLVKNDFGFTEGVVWVDEGKSGYLLLSDMYANVIYKVTPEGKVSLYLNHSGYTGYDKRFGGTNDLVVKKDGAIYFTDGFGGLRGRDKDPGKELDFAGIFMWKDGKVTLAIKDIPTPNGLAFSPDEKILYANGSQNRYVRRYDVEPDDTLTNSQMLIDMNSDPAPGITDGMKVDTKGNIYESGPGGIWILSPEGKHLGTIRTPEFVANVAFGDADNKTLYIAARTGVYKIRVNTPGIR